MAATPRSSAPTPVKSCALRRRLLPAAWLLVLLLVLGGETGAQGAGEGGGAASDEAKPATITVRYFRFDGKASAWSLYVAAPGKPGKTLRGVADEQETCRGCSRTSTSTKKPSSRGSNLAALWQMCSSTGKPS